MPADSTAWFHRIMFALIYFLVWVLYFGLTAAVMIIDGRVQRAKIERGGGVDFMDRSLVPYFVTALVCGPAPLILYFGSTRRSALGYLMGLGAAIAVYVATVIGAGLIASVVKAVLL